VRANSDSCSDFLSPSSAFVRAPCGKRTLPHSLTRTLRITISRQLRTALFHLGSFCAYRRRTMSYRFKTRSTTSRLSLMCGLCVYPDVPKPHTLFLIEGGETIRLFEGSIHESAGFALLLTSSRAITPRPKVPSINRRPPQRSATCPLRLLDLSWRGRGHSL